MATLHKLLETLIINTLNLVITYLLHMCMSNVKPYVKLIYNSHNQV